MSELHPATRGFAAADVYERGRPDYPAAAIARIVEKLELRPGRTVLDLAAGTGKLTRLLVPSGANVVAVEPLREMRVELERRVPAVAVLAGTAERIPLAEVGWTASPWPPRSTGSMPTGRFERSTGC